MSVLMVTPPEVSHAESSETLIHDNKNYQPQLMTSGSLEDLGSPRSPREEGNRCCSAPSCRCAQGQMWKTESSKSIQTLSTGNLVPVSKDSQVIRQLSQPESWARSCQTQPLVVGHSGGDKAPEGLAAIASDSLRINGALGVFKQVSDIFY